MIAEGDYSNDAERASDRQQRVFSLHDYHDPRLSVAQEPHRAPFGDEAIRYRWVRRWWVGEYYDGLQSAPSLSVCCVAVTCVALSMQSVHPKPSMPYTQCISDLERLVNWLCGRTREVRPYELLFTPHGGDGGCCCLGVAVASVLLSPVYCCRQFIPVPRRLYSFQHPRPLRVP